LVVYSHECALPLSPDALSLIQIKEEYLANLWSSEEPELEGLCDKYNLNLKRVQKLASEENWEDTRLLRYREVLARAENKNRDKIIEHAAANISSIRREVALADINLVTTTRNKIIAQLDTMLEAGSLPAPLLLKYLGMLNETAARFDDKVSAMERQANSEAQGVPMSPATENFLDTITGKKELLKELREANGGIDQHEIERNLLFAEEE